MKTDNMARDLEALRRHPNLGKITVAGHSNGAAIALSFAAQFPDSVEKLLLIATQLMGFDDPATWNKFAEKRSEDHCTKKHLPPLRHWTPRRMRT
jgi:proline iminopeptidase